MLRARLRRNPYCWRHRAVAARLPGGAPSWPRLWESTVVGMAWRGTQGLRARDCAITANCSEALPVSSPGSSFVERARRIKSKVGSAK